MHAKDFEIAERLYFFLFFRIYKSFRKDCVCFHVTKNTQWMFLFLCFIHKNFLYINLDGWCIMPKKHKLMFFLVHYCYYIHILLCSIYTRFLMRPLDIIKYYLSVSSPCKSTISHSINFGNTPCLYSISTLHHLI